MLFRSAVRIDDDTDYEPDALVNCGPPVDPDAIAAPNPVVVVEVLSPSTRAIDTGERLVDYFRVPSIQHFLVVHVRRREVAHHRRTVDGIASTGMGKLEFQICGRGHADTGAAQRDASRRETPQ